MDQEIFVKCSCSCSGIEIVRDTYFGKVFEFSFWTRYYERKIWGLRERLRWCWRILRTGRPWADEVIITDKDAARIVEFLSEHLD